MDAGPEDAGEGGAAGDGAFLLRLAWVAWGGGGGWGYPYGGWGGVEAMVAGAGAIRIPTPIMTAVGCGTDTSMRTSATSPILNTMRSLESRQVTVARVGASVRP